MDNIYEEYKEYVTLTSRKNNLNSKLLSLSGKNDEDSINQINNIGEELNQINTVLSLYNVEDLNKVANYYQTMERFNYLAGEIQTIEKLSKKSKGEKIELISAEGRKKYIAKELEEDFKELSSEKAKLKPINFQNYQSIRSIQTVRISIVENIQEKEISTPEVIEEKPKELSLDEKINELKDRMDRILQSGKLPNMGKKQLVTYNGKKYSIPSKYIGRYNEARRELSHLLNMKKDEEKPAVEVVNIMASLQELPILGTEEKISFLDMLDRIEKDKIELKPLVDIKFKDKQRVSLNNAFVTFKNKIRLNEFKKLLPYIYNLDKEIKLVYEKTKGKTLDAAIKVRDSVVNFKNGTVQRINAGKSFVKSMPKRALEKVKDALPYIYNIDKEAQFIYEKAKGKVLDGTIKVKDGVVKFKNEAVQKINTGKTFVKSIPKKLKNAYLQKREIISGIKENSGLKASMEKVYGEDKENHLDYRIVNRVTNFKENTCQRVNVAKGKITTVTKNIATKIKAPFDRMRETLKNDAMRSDLKVKIAEVKELNRQKAAALRRVKTKAESGYILTSTLIILGILLVVLTIFNMIKTMLWP